MFHIPDFIGEGAYFFRVRDCMFVPLMIYKNESSLGTEPVCYLTVLMSPRGSVERFSFWDVGSDSYP